MEKKVCSDHAPSFFLFAKSVNVAKNFGHQV